MDNPLYNQQPEKAGAQTYDKYKYQYHWALYRILFDHIDTKEYAVFIELHEDVIVSNSLDVSTAEFEFNQVKTSKPKFNTNQLIKLKNGKSVLGKLIESGLEKPFSSKISSLNLVALNDFNLELINEGVKLDKIRIIDLSEKQIKELETELNKELTNGTLPSNLHFIVPKLSEKNFQNDVIATISNLITKLFPGSYFNPVEIYRILIDELNRKGVVTYDYTKWDELLKNKALTSKTVTSVINDFTNIKDESKIEVEFNNICTELKLKIIQSKKLKRSFTRYRSQRISNTSTSQIEISNTLTKLINKNIEDGIEDMGVLIKNVSDKTSKKIKKQFLSQEDLESAIICEYIMIN